MIAAWPTQKLVMLNGALRFAQDKLRRVKHALSEAEGNLRLPNRDPSLPLRMTDYVAPSFLHIEWRPAPWMNYQETELLSF